MAVTGRDGRIAMGVPAEGMEGSLWLEAADGRMATLALQPRQGASSQTVTLSPVLSLAGRVLDVRTRRPVPDALVWKQNLFGWVVQTRTAADGIFRLAASPGRDPGLAAAAPGYVPVFQAEVAEDLTLPLRPAALLSGQVEDAAGRPIAGARVRALPAGEESFGFASSVETRSARDGKFRLRGLSPGSSWRLQTTAEGFAPGEQPAATGEPGQSPPPVRIVLGPGTTLAGRLLDPADRPVPGVEVVLQPSPEMMGMDWSPGEEIRATSGADGRFHLAHLGAGSLDLRTAHPDFAPAERREIQVPGRTAALDLGDLRLVPAATLEGRVTDEGGAPLAGVSVSSLVEQDFSRPPVIPETVQTGPDGRFRLRGLTPGQRIDVMAQRPGYVSFEAPGVEVPRAEPLDIVLHAERTLAGRVVDRAGLPVVQARILVVKSQEVSLGDGASSSHGLSTAGQTDPEGRFVLTQLEAGLLNLRIEASGFRPRTLQGVRIPERDEPSPLEVVLEPGTVLEGRVLTASGTPAAGVWVLASPFPQTRGQKLSGEETDADGRYRMTDLGDGRHEVQVQRRTGAPALRREIELTAGGRHRLDLMIPSGGAVSGRVVDSQGEPVAGAELSLASTGSPDGITITSSMDGSFRFADVEVGIYRLAGSARGYAPAAAPDDIQVDGLGEVRGLELRLLPGAAIRGRLLGLSDDDLRQVRVHAFQEDGSLSPQMMSMLSGAVDSAGLYRISSVGPGTWRVTASLSSGRQGTGTVQVSAPGEEAVLDLEISGGLTVSGRVLLDGTPLGGAEVTALLLVDGKPVDQRQVRSRYDGGFSITGLKPGRITLAVVSGGVGHARQIELLASDVEVTLDIATGKVAAHIFAADGQPIEGAVVTLQGENPGLGLSFLAAQTTTDEAGAFEVPRLAAGSYRITAQAPGFGPASQIVTVTPGGTTEVHVVLKGE